MKNVAFMALCIGSLGLFACGGGGDSPDAGGPQICGDDACTGDETAASCPEDCDVSGCDNDGMCEGPGETAANCPADCMAACNAIANTGCNAGEKCTYIIESTEPLLGRTGCADDGTMTEGQACTGAGTAEGGVDDCAGGLFCNDSVCTEICDALDNTNCDANEACVEFNGLFDDAENTGLCQPGCNPVAPGGTGCPSEEGCYIRTDTGRGSCAGDCRANPACDAGFTVAATAGGGTSSCADANWGQQHCECECLNCCSPGLGCLLNNMPGTGADGSVCAFFCDTTNSGGPTCGDNAANLVAISCRQISTFYSNTMNVPPAIGMCVDPEIWPCVGCTNDTDPGCELGLPSDCDCIMGTEPECNM
jgi:hypothetical protein